MLYIFHYILYSNVVTLSPDDGYSADDTRRGMALKSILQFQPLFSLSKKIRLGILPLFSSQYRDRQDTRGETGE